MLQDNENRFVTYQKRKYLMIYIIGCLLFVACGIWIIVNAQSLAFECTVGIRGGRYCYRNPVSYYIVGILTVLLFGIISLPVFYYFINPKLVFYMNEDGFYSKFGFIKWDAVTCINLCEAQSGKYITFKMKKREDVREIVSRLSFIESFFLKTKVKGSPYFTISFLGTGVNIEKIYLEMKKVYEQNNKNI